MQSLETSEEPARQQDSHAPIRVAMVLQSYPPILGGAQRQVQRLGPLLARRGVGVSVVTRRPPGTPAREREPGVDVHRLRVPAQPALASLVYVGRGAAATIRERPDVIHVHDVLSPGTIGLVAGARLGVPVVAKILSTGRGGDVDRLLHKPFGARRLRLISNRFAAFVCLSAEVEQELVGHDVPPERMFRIPNGVDVQHFSPPSDAERLSARRRLDIPDGAVVTLYCGRMAPVKRLDVLLDAFRGAPGHLLIAGDGSEQPEVRRLAASAELTGRVHVLSTVDDPAPLYRAADLYVSASVTEGMSGSVLEAMSSGLPVAASPASGMAELVTPATGVLASDVSAAALRRSICTLAGDQSLRATLGAAARTLICASYSLELTADRLATLYRSLLAARPA